MSWSHSERGLHTLRLRKSFRASSRSLSIPTTKRGCRHTPAELARRGTGPMFSKIARSPRPCGGRPRPSGPPSPFFINPQTLRTPHIALLCLDVLDALELRYAIYGGPANCCGILQFRPGDADNAGRQAYATIKRFAETGTFPAFSPSADSKNFCGVAD